MTKEYKDDLVTQRIPEDPPSVVKAKAELQTLIDEGASQGDIDSKHSEIQRLYRYEDDKAAGLLKTKGKHSGLR